MTAVCVRRTVADGVLLLALAGAGVPAAGDTAPGTAAQGQAQAGRELAVKQAQQAEEDRELDGELLPGREDQQARQREQARALHQRQTAEQLDLDRRRQTLPTPEPSRALQAQEFTRDRAAQDLQFKLVTPPRGVSGPGR